MAEVEPRNPSTPLLRTAAASNGVVAPASAPKPDTLERALGTRVRALRRALDLSVSDFAGAASISAGMLSKIENAQISPSLSTVQSIATALGVPIAALFTAADERLHCSLVRANEGVTIERRGSKLGHAYQLLGHVLGGDIDLEPYLITLAEDAADHTAFQHVGLELIYMLSGAVVYRHGDAAFDLRPGDTLLFDSAALHGPQEILERPTTYLSIIVSARSGKPPRKGRLSAVRPVRR